MYEKINWLSILFYEKVFNMQWWVGKIAHFGKALVRGALPKCAMWVGFFFLFCGWGEKSKINFHQICTVLPKSLLISYFKSVATVSTSSSVFYTCCQLISTL